MESTAIKVKEKIQLKQAHINNNSISFSETDPVMCVHEKGDQNEMLLVNIDNHEDSIKKQIQAEAVIMNTNGEYIALKGKLLCYFSPLVFHLPFDYNFS